MNGLQTDLIATLPEIFVLSMAMFILIADLFLKPSNRIAIFVLTQITLLGAAYITISTHNPSVTYAFSSMFVDDPFADVMKLMIYLATSIFLVYTRSYITLRGMFRGEFYALVLFALAGMMISSMAGALIAGQPCPARGRNLRSMPQMAGRVWRHGRSKPDRHRPPPGHAAEDGPLP